MILMNDCSKQILTMLILNIGLDIVNSIDFEGDGLASQALDKNQFGDRGEYNHSQAIYGWIRLQE